MRSRRALVVGAFGIALTMFIAACGPHAPAEVAPAASNPDAAWVNCLRAHGVSIPSANVMAGQVPSGGKGSRPLSQKPSADASVQAACAPYLPPMPDAVRQQWVHFVTCMRARGIPAPDPSFAPNGFMSLAYPEGVGPSMPGFSAAQSSCMQASGLAG